MHQRLPALLAFGAILALASTAFLACFGGTVDNSQVVVAGGTHTCALTDGRVSCWGNNYYGQVGTNDETDFIFTKTDFVDLGEPAVDLAAGYDHTCALTDSGTVQCWGSNKFGQLGAGTTDRYSPVPVEVAGLTGVVAVGTGYYHSCAVLDNGGLRCWGRNEFGELGNGRAGRDESAFEPEKVGGLRNIRQVDGGAAHTCAVTDSGDVYCWGSNAHGRLGDGSETDRLRPAQVLGLPEAAQSVAVGAGHTCVLVEGGRLFCWGSNSYGQLGNGAYTLDFEINATPREVVGIGGEVVFLASGGDHICTVTVSDAVYCWGSNDYGQIGAIEENRCVIIAFPCQLTPIVVEQLRTVEGPVAIAGGFDHTCVLYDDGEAMCWGANGVGQLGDGTEIDSLEPVTVIDGGSKQTR